LSYNEKFNPSGKQSEINQNFFPFKIIFNRIKEQTKTTSTENFQN